VFVLAVALVASPWAAHLDDGDANLYTVVARNMAERGGWLNPSYLPDVYPEFREHLPFGLWPQAVAIRLVGPGALGPLNALWTLATVALVGWLGRRLCGARAGLLAMLVLATTETFFLYGGRPRLDPLLVLLGTLAAAPLLLEGRSLRALLLAALAGAAAALIKGPFGLLPMVAAAVARGLVTRSVRPVLVGAVATVLAALPVTGFLLWDRHWGDGTWWWGYAERQLLASATGARTDGKLAFWFPFRTIASRFWPGLPLVLLGAWTALRQARAGRKDGEGAGGTPEAAGLRMVALFSLFVVLGLCLPTRKLWNHALVAYPGLALLAGAGAAPWVERFLQAPRRKQLAMRALVGLALLVSVASAVGLGRYLVPKPCVASREFAPEFDGLAPGTRVPVVAAMPAWVTVAALAAERRLAAQPVDQLSVLESHEARLALVEARVLQASPPRGWHEVRRARDWVLLVRDP
jgi:4-amino-4-deoxy-L-arabinose transferase-like glycosyltransferase